MKNTEIHWLPEPRDSNYPAAESYLSLLLKSEFAAMIARRLRDADVVSFYAKDILRASGSILVRLGEDNHHVKKNLAKIDQGVALSPILLVRNSGMGLIIADGFHRVCAVYIRDEDSEIPCKIV